MPADPSGIGRITFHFRNADSHFGCGIDALVTNTGVDLTDAETVAVQIADDFVANVLPLLSVGMALHQLELKYSDGTSEMDAFATIDNDGSAGGDMLPLNCALVVSWVTGEVYRGGKGRTYFGAIPESAIDTNHSFSPTYVGNFETAIEAFHGAQSGWGSASIGSVSLGVVHRHSGGAPITPVFAPAGGTRTRERICSQRRRLGPLF